jgi:hypothetical protein
MAKWIKSLADHGERPSIRLLSWCDDRAWQFYERSWIFWVLRHGNLYNRDGGGIVRNKKGKLTAVGEYLRKAMNKQRRKLRRKGRGTRKAKRRRTWIDFKLWDQQFGAAGRCRSLPRKEIEKIHVTPIRDIKSASPPKRRRAKLPSASESPAPRPGESIEDQLWRVAAERVAAYKQAKRAVDPMEATRKRLADISRKQMARHRAERAAQQKQPTKPPPPPPREKAPSMIAVKPGMSKKEKRLAIREAKRLLASAPPPVIIRKRAPADQSPNNIRRTP